MRRHRNWWDTDRNPPIDRIGQVSYCRYYYCGDKLTNEHIRGYNRYRQNQQLRLRGLPVCIYIVIRGGWAWDAGVAVAVSWSNRLVNRENGENGGSATTESRTVVGGGERCYFGRMLDYTRSSIT